MAQPPKKAKVIRRKMITETTVHIVCQMQDPEDLGFRGGQFIIVNSGVVMENGNLGKRAYSIITADHNQSAFELIVKRVNDGVGSNFIHSLKEGDVFQFSGPWGKTKPFEGETGDEKICCIATDTGVTSFLGLLKGKAYMKSIKQADIFWMTSAKDYFFPFDYLKDFLPLHCTCQLMPTLSPIGSENRWEQCIYEITQLSLSSQYDKIYLSGDGHVLGKMEQWFVARGYREEQIIKESFFHHETLKAPSAKGLASK